MSDMKYFAGADLLAEEGLLACLACDLLATFILEGEQTNRGFPGARGQAQEWVKNSSSKSPGWRAHGKCAGVVSLNMYAAPLFRPLVIDSSCLKTA